MGQPLEAALPDADCASADPSSGRRVPGHAHTKGCYRNEPFLSLILFKASRVYYEF